MSALERLSEEVLAVTICSAQQSTTRLLGDVAVDVKAGGVVRRLSKDRLTEIEELAMAIVLSCSPTMEKGYAAWHDADAEARHEKYLRIALARRR